MRTYPGIDTYKYSIGKVTIGIDSMHACQWRTKLLHLLPIVMLRVARLGATVRISEAIVLMRWMGIYSHTHTHGIELNCIELD